MTIKTDILLRMKNGDEEAFESLYNTYVSRVHHFAFSLLLDKSMADDVAQETFLKLWENRKNIDVRQDINAYIFTIARHLVYKETELSLKLKSLSIENVEIDDNLAAETNIEEKILLEDVNREIEKLPPQCKRIFKMSRFERKAAKKIAEELSLSERTVETQLYRANKFLRSKLLYANIFILVLLLSFIY